MYSYKDCTIKFPSPSCEPPLSKHIHIYGVGVVTARKIAQA